MQTSVIAARSRVSPILASSGRHWTLKRWHFWLLVLGLLLRVAYSLTVDKESSFAGLDGKEYLAYAQSLLSLHGDDYPRFFNDIRPPGYPFFLMPFVEFGSSVVWPIQLFQCVIGTFLAIVLAKIAGRWCGQRAGDFACALVLVHPFLIYFCAYVMTETLFMALLWLGVACLQAFDARVHKNAGRALFAAAVILAFACLTRPTLQPFLPVAAAWLAWRGWRGNGWRRGLKVAAQFTVVVSALLLPWMIRNFEKHHSWSLAPGSGEAAYASANSLKYLTLHEAKSKAEYYAIQDQIVAAISVESGESEQDWLQSARDFRQNHPREWLRLQWLKFRHFWTPWLNPLIFSKRDFLLSLVSATPLFLLAAAEFVRRRKRWDDPLLVLLSALILVGYLVGGLIFHVQVRYRIPFVDIAFLLLAASLLAQLVNQLHRYKSVHSTLLRTQGRTASTECV